VSGCSEKREVEELGLFWTIPLPLVARFRHFLHFTCIQHHLLDYWTQNRFLKIPIWNSFIDKYNEH